MASEAEEVQGEVVVALTLAVKAVASRGHTLPQQAHMVVGLL